MEKAGALVNVDGYGGIAGCLCRPDFAAQRTDHQIRRLQANLAPIRMLQYPGLSFVVLCLL